MPFNGSQKPKVERYRIALCLTIAWLNMHLIWRQEAISNLKIVTIHQYVICNQLQNLRRKFWGDVNAKLSELNITEKEKEKLY